MLKKVIVLLSCFVFSLSLFTEVSALDSTEYTLRSKSKKSKSKKERKGVNKQSNPNPLAHYINIQCRNDGMFSLFFDVLYALWEFENGFVKALHINFGQKGLYYEPSHGENWWEYYCQPIRLGKVEGPIIERLYGREPHLAPWDETSGIPRAIANELIVKYIHPKQHILDKVEQFCRHYYSGTYVIGVHYRGTDKICEAPRVRYEEVAGFIAHSVDVWERANPTRPCRIFVATDEESFIDYAASIWGDRVCYRQTIRSVSGRPIHYGGRHSPYLLGEEAFIDMLLLSKCDLLIRTSSNLSLCSTLFNPTLPVIELNQRN